MNITGLILAGGAGRRVDSRDKGLIVWQGKPLIAHVSDRIQPQVGQLLISCNRNFERYQAFATTTVADTRLDYQGPLAGLEAASPLINTELLVVVACDTPLLPADLVQRLISPLCTAGNKSPAVSYAHDGARAQYLCAAMHSKCLSSLGRFLDDGHRTVHHWIQQQHSVAVDFSDQPGSFRNYNRMD